MRLINLQLCVVFLTFFIISCENNEKGKHKMNVEVESTKEEKIAHIEVNIEGMTCEIGCAKLIQSKLYKTNGVNYASVSFEKGKGEISFDENKITNTELKTLIEGIAGGDLYKVVQMENVKEFKKVVTEVNM